MRLNRKASQNDIRGINGVIEANQKEPNSVYKYPCTFDKNENLKNRSRVIFVTEVDSIIIAFLSLHGRNLFDECCEADFEMVVHPAHRDREKHYGENLLKYVISYAREETNIGWMLAKILKENNPSINLCEKCGFSRIKSSNEKSKGIDLRLTINR
jgi:RimJ/RimL family protein N-acetyltransferase